MNEINYITIFFSVFLPEIPNFHGDVNFIKVTEQHLD